MRRILPSLLVAAFLLLATTYAGMAFFGMHGSSGTDMACLGADCGPMDHGTAAADCLYHCLGQVPQASPSVVQATLMLFVLLAILVRTEYGAILGEHIVGTARRWCEGIGKTLRHQSLSTVVLRN